MAKRGRGSRRHKVLVEGEYLEVEPPRRVVYTWVSSYGGPERTVVHFELEPRSVHALHPSGPKKAGTGTFVRVRHEGFGANVESAKSHGEGWKRVLGWLEAFVVREESSPSSPMV